MILIFNVENKVNWLSCWQLELSKEIVLFNSAYAGVKLDKLILIPLIVIFAELIIPFAAVSLVQLDIETFALELAKFKISSQ